MDSGNNFLKKTKQEFLHLDYFYINLSVNYEIMVGKRKNKTFDYKPRYYQGERNPFKISHKFDDSRSTVDEAKGLKAKFVHAIQDFKQNRDSRANRLVLIFATILALIFLYVIDFDLSIFKNN